MKIKGLFTLVFLLALAVNIKAGNGVIKAELRFMLGETTVMVNVYEKPGSKITFFAPHYNEQTGLKLAKEYIERKGGRVVEIQSVDEKGVPSRYLKFVSEGKTYNIDPNRIFTDNGRLCNFITPDIDVTVKAFADNILKTIFINDGKNLREGERVLVAVHNNSDVDGKSDAAKLTDLTAVAFFKGDNTQRFSHGVFSEQANGVFLSNTEDDADNFVFLSDYTYMRHFSEKGFNVIVQKPSASLQSKKCTVDDGSLSVYSGQQNIPYICLEADGVNGSFRQRQMLEAVYQIVQMKNETTAKEVKP